VLIQDIFLATGECLFWHQRPQSDALQNVASRIEGNDFTKSVTRNELHEEVHAKADRIGNDLCRDGVTVEGAHFD
jgi:hypothetical protein